MSARKNIRLAAVTAIDAIPSLTGRVSDTRAQSMEKTAAAQPWANVYTAAEGRDTEFEEMSTCAEVRETRLSVELWAFGKTGAAVAGLMDDLEASISAALKLLTLPEVFAVNFDSMEQTVSQPEDTGDVQSNMVLVYLVTQR